MNEERDLVIEEIRTGAIDRQAVKDLDEGYTATEQRIKLEKQALVEEETQIMAELDEIGKGSGRECV